MNYLISIFFFSFFFIEWNCFSTWSFCERLTLRLSLLPSRVCMFIDLCAFSWVSACFNAVVSLCLYQSHYYRDWSSMNLLTHWHDLCDSIFIFAWLATFYLVSSAYFFLFIRTLLSSISVIRIHRSSYFSSLFFLLLLLQTIYARQKCSVWLRKKPFGAIKPKCYYKHLPHT